MPVEQYISLMGLDKKVIGGKMRFVLLHPIGHAIISSEAQPDVLRQTIEACCAEH
jgi:3-dehydroquinate synthase